MLQRPDARARRRTTPTTTPSIERDRRATSASARDHVVLTNGLDDGIMLASLVTPARRDRGRSVRSDRRPAGIRHVRGVRRRARRADRRRAAAAGLLLPAAASGRGDHARGRAIIFLTNPNNPTGLSIPRTVDRGGGARPRPQALVFLDEAYADFAGQTMIDDAAIGRDSQPGRRPDVREGVRPGRTARRRAGRLGRDAGADPPRRPALHAERLRRGGAAGGARRPRVLRVVSRGGARIEDAALRRARAAGRPVLAERRQLRARLLRRRPRARRSPAWRARHQHPRSIRAIPAVRAAPGSPPAWSTTRAG